MRSPGPAAERLVDDCRQLAGAGDRARPRAAGDGAHHGMGPPFLAEHPQKMLEGWLLEGVDDIGGAHPMTRHAHVERAVMREGEAARAVIELHRRHADIEQDAIDALDTGRRHELDHLGEASFEQHQAIAENSLECPAVADGARIAIDGIDPRLRPFEQQAGVAAGAERAVDIDAAVPRREVRQ